MISMETGNYIKYYSKILLILLVIFLLLNYVVSLKTIEALLLACIIAVSVLIIENIIIINNITLDPLNCDECKINNSDDQNTKTHEPFVNDVVANLTNTGKNLGHAITKVLSNMTPQKDTHSINTLDDDNFEYRCIRVPKTSPKSLPKTLPKTGDDNNSNKEPSNNVSMNKEPNEDSGQTMKNSNNTIMRDNTENFNNLEHFINRPSSPSSSEFAINPNTKPEPESENESNITYDASHNDYQKNGLETKEQQEALKNNLSRLQNGNQDVVKQFLQDATQYYNSIYNRSSDAPKANELLNSELKYGDLNYISPLNKGMSNSEYTYVSPNNWYPIPPVAPVCVTNKNCTTCPVQMSNGQDYMNFASLTDFDNSRRFTGNMNINVDYVKNVLNNSNGY